MGVSSVFAVKVNDRLRNFSSDNNDGVKEVSGICIYRVIEEIKKCSGKGENEVF